MRTSVIVTTLGGPHLGEQLQALSIQTRPADEVIVVNNGEPGAVTHVVDAWAPRLPRLRLVEDRAMGSCGYARNAGAAHAEEPALLFLDDDDVADRRYVEFMSRALDDAPMVAARIELDRLNPPELAARWRGTQDEGAMTFHGYLPWAIGGAFGIHRSMFERLGGYDTTIQVSEDTDICWRAQLAGAPAPAFEPRAVLSYRLRDTPRTAFRQARSWGRSEVDLYRRYRDRGYPRPPNQLRALLRWGRPIVVLARRPNRLGAVVAARLLGERVGRLQGSVKQRRLFL